MAYIRTSHEMTFHKNIFAILIFVPCSRPVIFSFVTKVYCYLSYLILKFALTLLQLPHLRPFFFLLFFAVQVFEDAAIKPDFVVCTNKCTFIIYMYIRNN